MHQFPKTTFTHSLTIIWTIAWKDILDAIVNRVVLGLVIMLNLVLLLPKLLPMVFEQPEPVVPVYVLHDSQKLLELRKTSEIVIQLVRSEEDFRLALCGALFPEIGLHLPVDFDQLVAGGGAIELQGYACWNKRNQVEALRPGLEESLSQLLNQPVSIHLVGNVVYPIQPDLLILGLVSMNAVLMILMMGMFLVPHLICEEKQTKTMQALLLSPASIGQVVAGKALAGVFYILVTAGVLFIILWPEVVHWGVMILFVLAGGFFSVAAGLVLGSFYERQQDAGGVMTILLLLLVGAILLDALNMPMPATIDRLLPWMPSLALANLCRAAFSETYSTSQLLSNLALILVVSLPLYGLVVWKIRRSDI